MITNDKSIWLIEKLHVGLLGRLRIKYKETIVSTSVLTRVYE